jgi:hypothetical protein
MYDWVLSRYMVTLCTCTIATYAGMPPWMRDFKVSPRGGVTHINDGWLFGSILIQGNP